jgi:RNA polymerase sigma-70 factor (sigma-E family)
MTIVTAPSSSRPSKAAASGREGLGELYVRHAPQALRLAYFLSGDRDAAEDLVQDAFVRLAGRFRHVRLPDAFEGYLRRTIVNLFTSRLRRLRLERLDLIRRRAERPSTVDPQDVGGRDEAWHALLALPQRQRIAVVLRFYEDLSERETAEVMGCSASAVNSLIARSMATLRDELRGEDG